MADLYIPDIPEDSDTLRAALVYAAAGWYVLPIRRNARKHPGSVVGKAWQHQSSRDPEVIASWFAGTDHGIALHLGRSGALALDVDYPDKVPGVLADAVEMAEPPMQTTRLAGDPARGHYVFAQPPGRMLGNGTGKLGGSWGEVRGKNGIIVVAPSLHDDEADGGYYQWQQTGPVPVLPDTIGELLNDAGHAEDAATDAEVVEFLDAHTGNDRPELAAGWVTTFTAKVAAGESRHEKMVSVAAGAMKEARAGYFPARQAAELLESAFLAAVAKDPIPGSQQRTARKDGMAQSEWSGILAWAVAQAKAADLAAVRARVAEKMPQPDTSWMDQPDQPPAGVDPGTGEVTMTLDECHQVYRRWLGEEYELQVLDVVLSVAATVQLGGDPPWLLVVGGSGAAKTETVAPLSGAGAYVESTIASEAALLSGTPKHERSKKSTGGLLRKMGAAGLLVLKDFTSVISQNKDTRAMLLAALREIHDGRWTRNVGTEGGYTLTWTGRLVLVGAVTTAYDQAHAVIASMGDRFALVRLAAGAGKHRRSAGRQALSNVDHETAMRAELAAATGSVLAGVRPELAELHADDANLLLSLADLVTLARTGVIYDPRGDVVDCHAPEYPTRFAKMLGQIVRGGLSLGMAGTDAFAAAVRVAGDSVPPMRLAVLADVAANPGTNTTAAAKRLGKPRATVDRALQSLHILELLDVDSDPQGRWCYRLADTVDPAVLAALVTRSPDPLPQHPIEERVNRHPEDTSPGTPSGESGNSCGCGAPLDQHAAPDCDTPVIHRPPDLWSTP